MLTSILRVGDVALRYRLRDRGGEPLVCMHGVGSYLEAWDEAAEQLSERFSVLTFDLRGHGGSSRIRGPYEIDDFVRETLALADHVGFSTFHLAGFSLGGLVAQRLALTRSDRIRSLTLLSSVAGRTLEERERVLGRLEALRTTNPNAHHDASLSRWLTEDFQERHPERIAELRRRDAENDHECYTAAYRVLAETDFGGVLDQIRVPTLIATGSEDEGSTPRMARFMHEQIAGSALAILPGLRHSILIEAPGLVADMMTRFLAEKAHG